MLSPTDHTTYPKNFEGRRQLTGLCDEPIDCWMEGKIKRHCFSIIRSSKQLSTIWQRKKALMHFYSKCFLFSIFYG